MIHILSEEQLQSLVDFAANPSLTETLPGPIVSKWLADNGHVLTTGNPERPMTAGERMVGLKFNPSGSTDVDDCKRMFAKIYDSVMTTFPAEMMDQTSAQLFDRIRSAFVSSFIHAQMDAVKLLTWR